jgi:hypothetical protein
VHCTKRAVGMLVLAGCSVGAPSGFSGGDHWVFPLVGPLEDGLLITPATVRGHGPYLFAIDPDANLSAIDKQIVDDAVLLTSAGPRIVDETDHGQVRLYAELLGLQVANLTVERRSVLLFPVGYYDTEGRHISGILGRDVIADSLVFGFDRDQGIATLSTSGAFTPPPDAIAIPYEDLSGDSGEVAGKYPAGNIVARGGPRGRGGVVDPYGNNVPSRINEAERQDYRQNEVLPVPRRIAAAQIGGVRHTVHLDLGAAVSQLPESSWGDAHLTPADVKLRLVDEAASVRYVTKVGVAAEVTLGPLKAAQVAFAPFVDQRFPKRTLDGVLGLDFFRGFTVYANWHKQTYHLKPRGDAAATATARLGRWAAALPACPHPGCVTAQLAAAAGGPTLEVVRDAESASRGLEVLLAVAPAPGKSAVSLIVELPRGVDRIISNPLPADYAGATLQVADVSPFPRACAGEGGCVLPLGGIMDSAAEPPPTEAPPADAQPAAAVPAPPPTRNVLADKLHRLSGDPAIPPSDQVKKAAGDRPLATAIVRMCLAADGTVESTKVVKSSGVAVYDDQLQSAIRTSWTFSPVETDGRAERVCTQLAFVTNH